MNRTAIIAVFAIFLIPVVLATLMHSEWLDWQPGGARNHGELINPVIAIDDFSVTDARQEPIRRETLLDKWQLIHVLDGICDESCLEDLYWLRQVRLAQDRHQPEIGLIFLTPQEQTSDTLDAIYELADDFIVLHGKAALAIIDELPDQTRQDGFYIADPLANIIMRYPIETDHNGIRRDLRRLLTWTQRD